MTDAYWIEEARKDFMKNPDGTTNNAYLSMSPSARYAAIHKNAKAFKERAKELGVSTMGELKQKEKDMKAKYAAKQERERLAAEEARRARERAEQEASQRRQASQRPKTAAELKAEEEERRKSEEEYHILRMASGWARQEEPQDAQVLPQDASPRLKTSSSQDTNGGRPRRSGRPFPAH